MKLFQFDAIVSFNILDSNETQKKRKRKGKRLKLYAPKQLRVSQRIRLGKED